MSSPKIIGVIIAVAILMVSLPILETALVDAGDVTGASTNFTTAVTISELVLGFVPIGLLLWFLKSRNSD